MFTGQFWTALRKRLEERKTAEGDTIVRGKVTTFDRYQNRVGYIEALDWVISEARDILGDKGEDRHQSAEDD